MPGKKYRSIKNPKFYEKLKRQGKSKESAARISNAQAAGTIKRKKKKKKRKSTRRKK